MNQKLSDHTMAIDLKELEKKAFRSTFQDGLMDICIGMIILATALSITLSDMDVSDTVRISIYVPIMLSGSVIIGLGKRLITIPRMGQVTFSNERILKIAKLHVLIVVAVLVTVAFLGLVVGGLDVGKYTGDLALALLIITIFYGISYFFDLPRMAIYGIFLALSNGNRPFRELDTGIPPGLPAFIMATIVLVIGIRTLKLFLTNYPLPENDLGAGDTDE